MTKIEILDTTLRDGAQSRGVSFSVDDKLAIAATLDELGIDLIELGNPESNQREIEVFRAARSSLLRNSTVCAFGSTRRKGETNCESLQKLVDTGASVAVIFGKSWTLHVREILGTTPDENCRMIADSVEYLRFHGMDVIFDAEHFFDGMKDDPEYAMQTLDAAYRAGARTLVLCDTNGGCFPTEIAKYTAKARERFGDCVGIHCHDDCGLAVANSIAAVQAGARHVQGTLLGYGERCGNTNLSTLLPDLQLKLGFRCLPENGISNLYYAVRRVAEFSNITLSKNLPYVGSNAFAHKAGMHADGVTKNTRSFEHIDPETVGNYRRFVASELAGRSTILYRLQQLKPELTKDSTEVMTVLEQLKAHEQAGYTYEAADASFELMARRALGMTHKHFETVFYRTLGEYPTDTTIHASSLIKIRVGNEETLEAGEGNGPVNALDEALRHALTRFFPRISESYLSDFKVRVLNPEAATAALTRVLITSTDGRNTWTTIGISGDILEACRYSLEDSIEYKLMLDEKENK